MRNMLPQDVLERIGHIPQPILDTLRLLTDAWYKLEQSKLAHVADGDQLRQAQGAAQILEDLNKVLADPAAFRNVPVPARRSHGNP